VIGESVCPFSHASVEAFRTANYHADMRTQTVNLHAVKNQLADLIATASEGGEVIIIENGKALARLVPASDSASYKAHPPTAAEFSSDEESLAWGADGWENVA
jgi:prevent-host-death family protein